MADIYKLKFGSEGEEQTEEIQQPFGVDGLVLKLKQEDRRLARDKSYSGASELEYTDRGDHQIEKLLYYDDKFGPEAKVHQIISNGGDEISMQIDFQEAETDGFSMFKAPLIQDSILQSIKRRDDTKINLSDSIGLNGEPIEPLVPEKILLLSKPIFQESKWEQGEEEYTAQAGLVQYANLAAGLSDFGIEDSYTPFFTTMTGLFEDLFDAVNNFRLIEAKNNISSMSGVMTTDIDFLYRTVNGSANSVARIKLIAAVYDYPYNGGGATYTIYEKALYGNSDQDFTLPEEVPFTIPNMSRGKSFSMFWQFDYNTEHIDSDNRTKWIFRKSSFTIQGSSTSYNSVTPTYRLVDVMRYIIKSICGKEIIAPQFDEGGPLYDQRVFTENLLRFLTEKPVYITLKNIREGIAEFYGDCEVEPDGRVFFGLYPEFYRDEELMYFSDIQFSSFRKKKNPKLCLKDFKFRFRRYQSQKEGTEEDTADGVHGESEWIFPVQNADNTREVNVEWERDSAGIEKAKREAMTQPKNVASKYDDNLFAIDVNTQTLAEAGNAISFNETEFLKHIADEETNRLSLKNTGNFSWIFIGITAGQSFQITNVPPQENDGMYTVESLNANTIILIPNGFNVNNNNDGERNTNFTYSISTADLVGVSWSNEGFTAVEGIANNGKDYSNLRFTNKRDIENFFQPELAAANLCNPDSPLKNTYYKNNPGASTTYDGQTITEGAEFTPKNPILSQVLYTDVVFASVPLADFISLQNLIRTKRGFVRFFDSRGFVRKMYIQEMDYSKKLEQLTIVRGEEKYEPTIINIVRLENGAVSINNGEYTFSVLKHKFIGEKLRIMDNQEQLLYNPLFWHRIAINGNRPTNLNELKSWLLLF